MCSDAGEPCSGIIYCHKRQDTTFLAQQISKVMRSFLFLLILSHIFMKQETGIVAAPYHAGLSDKDRNETVSI